MSATSNNRFNVEFYTACSDKIDPNLLLKYHVARGGDALFLIYLFSAMTRKCFAISLSIEGSVKPALINWSLTCSGRYLKCTGGPWGISTFFQSTINIFEL
jgi:hypothetical protein